MFKKNLSLFLVGSLLLSLSATPAALAKTKEEKEAALAAKVKASVAKLGAGNRLHPLRQARPHTA